MKDSISPSIPPVVAPKPDAPKRYHVGTLTYTKRGLIVLFVWLLWGDFCYTMMEAVTPGILPLKFKELGAPNWLMAAVLTTLPGIFNTTICPWVSFKSDSYRSRWGRRLPFIIYTMPFLTVALFLIGMSEQIGGWLHGWFLSGSSITKTTVIVAMLITFAAVFDLFNMFVSSVYWYLFNDVVPEQFLGRFNSWFRLVGAASGSLYSYFIYPHALSHMREIYIGAAILYFFGFGMMCLKVKEGQYPPPPDTGQKPSLRRDIATFFKECYSIPYYWNIFLCTMFTAIAGTIGIFGVFQYQSLGFDLSQLGKLGAVGGAMMAGCLLFAGILIDRWNPVRVDVYLQVSSLFYAYGCVTWLIMTPPPVTVLFWMSLISNVLGVLFSAMSAATMLPRLMILFPKDRFGAFCGAQALIRAGGTMIGGLLAGIFIDVVKNYYPPGDLYPYRYTPVWSSLFMLIAFYFNYRVFRYWKRLGGDTDYVPPTTKFRYKDLPKAKNTKTAKGLLYLLFIPSIIAGIPINIFWLYYYHSVMKHPYNFKVYLILTVIGYTVLPFYYRFFKFMERE